MEQNFNYNPAYDWEKKQYKHFKAWQSAVIFAQSHKMKHYTVVKVEDHYELH